MMHFDTAETKNAVTLVVTLSRGEFFDYKRHIAIPETQAPAWVATMEEEKTRLLKATGKRVSVILTVENATVEDRRQIPR